MKRQILRGEVCLQDAQNSQSNMLVEFGLPEREQEFLGYLIDSRNVIATAVAQHMNASRPPSCEVLPHDEWMKGSFNICIPVSVSNHQIRRVVIRFPIPYKIGEVHFPGNTDEKIITEAATYALLDEICPEVPRPQLLGYALSNGRRVIGSGLEYIILIHALVYSA
ncbi:MAG: hypothetical protein MMC23_006956 [Stictis urceolatum]|nr:hypothetical protein [Stictis urceolata]